MYYEWQWEPHVSVMSSVTDCQLMTTTMHHFITVLATFLFTNLSLTSKFLVEATFGQCVALQIFFFISTKATCTAWSNNLCGVCYTKGFNWLPKKFWSQAGWASSTWSSPVNRYTSCNTGCLWLLLMVMGSLCAAVRRLGSLYCYMCLSAFLYISYNYYNNNMLILLFCTV